MRYVLQAINGRGETIVLDSFKDMRQGYNMLKNLKEKQKNDEKLKQFDFKLIDTLVEGEIQ